MIPLKSVFNRFIFNFRISIIRTFIMKIKAIIEFDSYEREFIIPCGTGDKNFKWLAMAASQRYSNAAPNGTLRRRDEYCGISEKAQYQITDIVLPSGDSPHPAEMINFYLRDGDEVFITLGSHQPLETLTHSPSKSQWTKLAFDNTGDVEETTASKTKLGESKHNPSNDDDNTESFESKSLRRKNLEAETLAKAKFMREVLKTQMLNAPKIIHFMKTEWGKVAPFIAQVRPPQEREQEYTKILNVYIEHSDILLEIFKNYSPSGYLLKENFLCLVEDAQIFPPSMLSEKSTKIYDRVCKYVGISNTSTNFIFSHLLCAILLIAQSKYNDTLDSKQSFKKSVAAIEELFVSHFVPLARDLQLKCILKVEFVSVECLSRLRGCYDQLHSLFDKCAAKTRDIPTTVPISDVHDILYQAGLTDDKNSHTLTIQLFEEVGKSGTIFGRETILDSDDDPLPTDEFTFPEFVEAIARAGYYRFNKKDEGVGGISHTPKGTLGGIHSTSNAVDTATGGEEDGEGEMSIVDCMVRGSMNVVESITNPNAHRKAAQSKSAGGKLIGQNRKK